MTANKPTPEELLKHLRANFEQYLRRINALSADTSGISMDDMIAVLKIKIKPNIHSDELLEKEVYPHFPDLANLTSEQKTTCKQYLEAMSKLV